MTSAVQMQTELADILKQHSTGANAWLQRRHLLDTRDLTIAEIECFLHTAKKCQEAHTAKPPLSVLAGKTVANVFYENSTRTRSSFDIAAQRLGANTLNLDTRSSSVTKGESLVDTARQLARMNVDAIVQRHSSSGSAHLVADELGDQIHVLNAGDGLHAHPTQALLDLLTMWEARQDLKGAKVAIVGDISHSRVARSNIHLLKTMGASVHVSGPPTLLPADIDKLGPVVHNRLESAIEDADFIIMLRLQLERQTQGLIPSIGEYRKLFRLDRARLKLASPQVRILHPGPVNRGIEIADDLVDEPYYSLISTQVTNGVAARMAVIYLLLADRT